MWTTASCRRPHLRGARAWSARHHGEQGPIVHAYRALRDLAAAREKRFLFESTVMDGVPIFSLFDEMPAIHLKVFMGSLIRRPI